MPLQDFVIKKRILNIIFGLSFGVLANCLHQTLWSYVFYIISVLLLVFTDKIIKKFLLNASTGKFKLRVSPAKIIKRDKNGNIVEEK